MEERALDRSAGAARPAIIAINAWIAIEIGVIVACLDFVAGGGYDVWFATGPVVALAQLVGVVTFFLSGMFVLHWFYRAMAAAHRITPGLTISPGGAVGWFFVPIASLWKPHEAMVQIVEGSGRATERRRPVRELIFWWWGAWIARSVVGLFLQFTPRDDGVSPTLAVLVIVFAALGIASAVVLQMLIRGVGRLQSGYVDPRIFD